MKPEKKSIPVRQIKHAEKETALDFRIRTLKALLAGKDMTQELHRHNFYFVLVLEKGSGTHEIDFTPYKVGNHSIFIMRPGQVHLLSLRAASTGYLLEFSAEFYQPKDPHKIQVFRKATSTNVCQVNSSALKKLQSLLSYIHEEYHHRQEGFEDIIKSNLDIFFIEFIRQRQQRKSPVMKGNSYEQEKLEEFLELLEKNATTKKQVSQYADAMNMSIFQLNSITKTTLDKTASDVIREHIILESKRLLLATSEQINQIAYHLGYEDPSYFIRFFKKHTGHSPEAFRLNFK